MAWEFVQKIICECGKQYRLLLRREQFRDSEVIKCFGCDRTVYEYDEASSYRIEEIPPKPPSTQQ